MTAEESLFQLYLHNNKFSLMPDLSRLNELKYLHVQYNQITQLGPRQFLNNSNLMWVLKKLSMTTEPDMIQMFLKSKQMFVLPWSKSAANGAWWKFWNQKF